MTAPIGLCPRCGGTDIYFAKRQRITGFGGIWGNRAKMVDTPLCKACGEVANLNMNSAENREFKKEKTSADLRAIWKVYWRVSVCVLVFLGLFALLFA
jgi:predicted RNA-binding Zn-ribbon protein involved in translation (DUF1610 family)